MHHRFVVTIILLVPLILSGCTFPFLPSATNTNINRVEVENTNSALLGGDRDEHGCIGSAGYTWCPMKETCLRFWETPCFADTSEEIRYWLAEKYSKSLDDVSVTIKQETDTHAVGSVFFASPDLPSPGEGGLFLALKDVLFWKLIYDGNGSVDCPMLTETYQFPISMLEGICD